MVSKRVWLTFFALSLFFFAIAFGMPTESHAVWANNCKVTQMNMNGSSGNVIIQATCGSTDGRVTVSGSDSGANKMVAALLTSIAMNTRVNFDLFAAFDNSGQVVKGIQLSNPN